MTTYPSSWKPTDLPVLREIEGTTDLHELSRDRWPTWALRSTQFNRILAYSRAAEPGFQPASLSTGILAGLLTERIDLEDASTSGIYNYNLYLIAQTTDQRLLQSSPIRPTDPSHHSSSPSTWFDDLVTPL